MKHIALYAACAATLLLCSCKEKIQYPDLLTDQQELSVEYGSTAELSILSGSGTYSIRVEDESVVTAELDQTIITVTPVSETAAETNLIITDDLAGAIATIPVKVRPFPVIRFHNTYRFSAINFLVDAKEEDRDGVWVDLDGDGVMGEGEKVEDFGVMVKYPKSENFAIYGRVTTFQTIINGLSIDEIDVTASVYLEKLVLQNNKIESIDLSNNTAITELNLSNNPNLTTLDVSNLPLLTKLSCSATALETLDLSNNPELIEMDCINSGTKSIEFGSLEKVTKLNIWNNAFESINVSQFADLTFLNVSNCKLSSLDVSANTKLEMLSCGGNAFTSLDLSNNGSLTQLFLDGNELSDGACIANLPAPEKIEKIQLARNKFSALDFSGFTNLKYITIETNQIKDAEMTALLNSLPQRTKEDAAKIYIMDSSRIASTPEGNEVSDSHIELCTQKKWQAFDTQTGGDAIALNVIRD